MAHVIELIMQFEVERSIVAVNLSEVRINSG